MAENSKIEWCDHTFNPWMGCTKVSEGCANCYAEVSTPIRTSGLKWGKGQPRQRTSDANWKKPLAWDKESMRGLFGEYEYKGVASGTKHRGSYEHGMTNGTWRAKRPRVFCASLADWLDPEVPIEWLADLLDLIRRTPYLDWLLLTKRPELWEEQMQRVLQVAGANVPTLQFVADWLEGTPASNVWIGTSVENQKRANERIPHLLKIPAAVRFLSCEPLLRELDIERWIGEYYCPSCGNHCSEKSIENMACPSCDTEDVSCDCDDIELQCPNCGNYGDEMGLDTNECWRRSGGTVGIHWVICGGESGTKARPMHPEWARSLRDQCRAAGVPFFFKQWGEWLPSCQYQPNAGYKEQAQHSFCEENHSWWVGKKAAGRLLDGREWNEMPQTESEGTQ